MRGWIAIAFVGAALGGASAQDNDYIPEVGPNYSCVGFKGGSQEADGAAMQRLSGVWQSEFPVRVQGYEPTVERVRMTRHAEGTLLYDEVECLQPLSAPGSPPLQARCVTATGRGYWYARPMGDDAYAVTVWQEGSGFGGNHVGPNCSTVRVRFAGDDTITNEFGVTGRKIGEAP